MKPLRVAFAGKVKSNLLDYTLDHKLAIHQLKPALDKLVGELDKLEAFITDLQRKLEATKASGRNEQRAKSMQRDLLAKENWQGRLKSKTYAMRQHMLRDVISQADVVSQPKLLLKLS